MNRRLSIRKSAWTGVLAKMAMVFPVLIIPKVLVPVLGPERFGIVLTILSLVTFLSVSDLGIGSNLITTLSRLIGEERYEEAARIQSNGFAVVGLIGLVLVVFSLVLFRVNLGAQLFPRSSSELQSEASQAIAVMVLMFAVTTPLMLVNKIQFAFQRGHIANLWQVVAAALNFAFACFAARMGTGIVGVVVGLSIGNVLCGIINTTLHLFDNPSCSPSLKLIDLQGWKSLISGSSFYLVMQLIYLVTFGLDAVLIARGVGAGEAAQYALADRFFSIVAIGTTIVTTPLWAVYGESHGAGQHDLAFRTLKKWTRRILLTALAITLSIVIMVNPVIMFLSSGTILVPLSLALAMAGWRIVESIGASLSVYIYTIDKVRFVVMAGTATALTSLLFKLALLPRLGALSLPFATTFCYIAFCLLPCMQIVRRFRATHPVLVDSPST
jgi:O-antigen/teichoic acid export membrane protein